MSNTVFNAEMLLNAAASKSFMTFIPPLPEQEFIFTVTKVEFKNPKDGVIVCELQVETADPVAIEATGMNPAKAKYSAFVDLTDQGMLDESDGKNIQLGRIREALGQNVPDVPWTPSMMLGGQFRGKISHKPDGKNPEIIRGEITAVAPV
jgi:hypothetical protein